MKINVMTTIEIPKDVNEPLTQEDVHNVYDNFREIIKDAVKFGDVTTFMFVNADTNMQIEDEVKK